MTGAAHWLPEVVAIETYLCINLLSLLFINVSCEQEEMTGATHRLPEVVAIETYLCINLLSLLFIDVSWEQEEMTGATHRLPEDVAIETYLWSGLPLTFKIRQFKTSSLPNLEVGITKHEESNPKLPVFFCFKMFYGHFIKFGLHARHLLSWKS